MSDFKSRLRRLQQKMLEVPSADEYLDANNRQRARAWKALAEEEQGFPGFLRERVITDWDHRILLNDTPEQRERDRQTIAMWRKAQGLDPETHAERAKEKWEAMLEVRAQQ